MARVNHTKSDGKSKNPATKFLEWKSNEMVFSYYDKSAGQNRTQELPFRFLFLQHYHNVKGWHERSQGGLWSNEVYYIGSEPITVRAFKEQGAPIASGLYKDIKAKVNAAGGKYHRSVYGVDANGSIINLQFKGSVVSAWSDFIEKNGSKLENNWVDVNGFIEMKKGMVSYTVPKFTVGEALSPSDAIKVDDAASVFQDYIDDYFAKGDVDNSVPTDLGSTGTKLGVDMSVKDLY